MELTLNSLTFELTTLILLFFVMYLSNFVHSNERF